MKSARGATAALLTAAVLLIAGCAAPSVPHARPTAVGTARHAGEGFGIAADFIGRTPGQIDTALQDYRSIGVSWARVQVLWYRIQPVRGGPFAWAEYDALFAAMKAHGIRPIALLSSTPPWARYADCPGKDGWELACPPADVGAFATFAAAAAARYPGTVWEVWNEPNLTSFWQPAPDPTAYTALLTATYRAIKKVDRTSTVLSAGLSLALDPALSTNAVTFLQGIYDAGGAGSFDGVGWHPYLSHPLGQPPALPDVVADDSAWYQMFGTAVSARSLMQTYGDGAKKIWVTEFGNHTGGGRSELFADETQQAAMFSDAVRLWSTYPWAGAFCFYTYQDSQPYGAVENSEAYFGLWRMDHTPKPAVTAIRAAIARDG